MIETIAVIVIVAQVLIIVRLTAKIKRLENELQRRPRSLYDFINRVSEEMHR